MKIHTYLHPQCIDYEELEQALSWDDDKETIEILESRLALAKIELNIAEDKAKLWQGLYNELYTNFMNVLQGGSYV